MLEVVKTHRLSSDSLNGTPNDLSWDAAVQETKDCLCAHAPNALFSRVMIEQIALCYYLDDHPYLPSRIYWAIKQSEQGTQKLRSFSKNGPFEGLFHIHHHQSQFIDWNRDEAIKVQGEQHGMSPDEYLHYQRREFFLERIKAHGDNQRALRESVNMIAYHIIKRIEENCGGEWIILARGEGRNFYLCMAMHEESKECIKVVQDRCRNGFMSYTNFEGRPKWCF